ncbi:MAG: T9SS type A sorting domain-containing protein, partial [Ignavibacteriae bacterium]|nr:T9SS type A sorting domain-containing protein [Ignavibacteriota bacterium]
LYNPTTVPGYAGDKNACGPAAAGNSLEWLEKTHPKTPLTGTAHREKMVELSKMMDRANEAGVTTDQLVKGKLAFIDKYKLPIRVKYQSVFNGDTSIKSPNNKYKNEAKNHNTGNKTPPKWDWLKQEMEHGEDVEILFGWYDSTGNRNGGHWITVTGLSEIGGKKGLYFKDDWQQGAAGGLRHPFAEWIEGDNGWSRIKGLEEGSSICWVESVVSESYDSTIHQDAEPLGINECKFFEMMFGLDEKKGEVQMKITPDEQLRYLNMWASKTDSKDLKWFGWNIFLAPFNVEQYYTFFFDFNEIGFNDGDRHDSLKFAYTVTDTPITKKDTIKNSVDIKLGITNIIIGNGSADTNLTTLPTILTSMPGFEGWDLKTWVYRGCEVPNIDLDSTRNNPGTVPGYAGDKNACGPAAAANSLEWLANTNPSLDPKNTHREKLKELSALMNRANNDGVMREDFIKAKLAFIDKYKLPIKVKFQGFKFGTNDINSPNPDFGHKASNKNDSANKSAKWDWLVQEMKDSEDVELEFGFYDNTGTRHGGHWITVTGVSDVGTAKGLYFKDDLNQRDSGGLRNPYVNLKDTLGYTYLQQLSTASGYTCWIETIVSESYDSTIKYTGVDDKELRNEYQLKIIPNPSPSGKNIDISFSLNSTAKIEAEIYDIKGNHIVQLYNGILQEGLQILNWKCKNQYGQNLSPGIYILSLKIDGKLLSENIIIE